MAQFFSIPHWAHDVKNYPSQWIPFPLLLLLVFPAFGKSYYHALIHILSKLSLCCFSGPRLWLAMSWREGDGAVWCVKFIRMILNFSPQFFVVFCLVLGIFRRWFFFATFSTFLHFWWCFSVVVCLCYSLYVWIVGCLCDHGDVNFFFYSYTGKLHKARQRSSGPFTMFSAFAFMAEHDLSFHFFIAIYGMYTIQFSLIHRSARRYKCYTFFIFIFHSINFCSGLSVAFSRLVTISYSILNSYIKIGWLVTIHEYFIMQLGKSYSLHATKFFYTFSYLIIIILVYRHGKSYYSN